MNPSLHRALTIHSTWAALPLFPVSELQDAAPLNPYVDEVRYFLDQGFTSDQREYACLCSDFSQGLQRHEEFQGPLAARLFAIGTRHWLVNQNVKKPHSNIGLLMSGSFWKNYSAECIRTFAPDRSLDWRSHVAAVSGFTKSLIKATWGNANTQYYCQREERGDDHEVVMDSLGMISLSPAAGCAMVFHEYMHGIKDSSETFLKMFESAKRRGYKGSEADLHPFFNMYEDIAVNVAGGSVLVDGLEDFRELYKGVFLINAYQLKKNYSIDSEFWVCSMARGLGETDLPFTPSAEVKALIQKHREALDDLTGPHSLPLSKKGLIRRDVCIDPAKLARFSNYRGEAEARLFFKLEEEFAGQEGQGQNLDNPLHLPQARPSGKGQSQEQRPGDQPSPGGQSAPEPNQEQSARSDPIAAGRGKAEKSDPGDQAPGDQAAKKTGGQKPVPDKSEGALDQSQDSGSHEAQAASRKEPAGNRPSTQEADPDDLPKGSGTPPSDVGSQKDAAASQGKKPNAQEKNAGQQVKAAAEHEGPGKEMAPDGAGGGKAQSEASADRGKETPNQGSCSSPQRAQGADRTDSGGQSGPGGNDAGQEAQPGGPGAQSSSQGKTDPDSKGPGSGQQSAQGERQGVQPEGAGNQPVEGNSVSAAGPDFSGLGEVGEGFELSEPLMMGGGPDGSTSADRDGKFKALESQIPRNGATREDLLQDGILGYGAPVDMSALREVQLEFAPVIRRGKRLFQGIRENAERAVQHRAKLVEEGDTFSIFGMAMRRSDPEHTLIFENPAQAIAVNHVRFGLILDMSGSTESGDRFKRLVEMAAVAALTIEDAGYQTSLGLFSSQGILLYHAEYAKPEKLRRLGGMVKVVRHSQDLQSGGASVGLTDKLGFLGGTESEKAVGTFVEAVTKTQSRNPGHFHGLIFTDGGLTERRLKSLITANPKLTWSVLCEGEVTQAAEDHFGKENTHAVQLDGDFIKTIFGAFSQSIQKFGSFQGASKIRKHYQETLRDARRMPPEKAINVIK
jgi:hypothetical protein